MRQTVKETEKIFYFCAVRCYNLAVMEQKKRYRTDQSLWVFCLLAVVGGFLETYTYMTRNKIFSNAQTGNFIYLSLNLAQGKVWEALPYLVPMFAYVLGILFTLFFPEKIFRGSLRWQTTLIGVEIVGLLIIGFIPPDAPNVLVYAPVSFLSAMQYNSFTRCREATLSTIFVTNNLRQVTVNLYQTITKRDRIAMDRLAVFVSVIVIFCGGVIVGAFAVNAFSCHAVWVCPVVLLPVFLGLCLEDVRTARQKRQSASD